MTTKMNISIPSPLKKWVDGQVAKNGYATADEFVLDILRREQTLAVREKIDDILIEAINSGPSKPMTPKDWERIRAAGLQRARQGRKK